MPLNSLLKCTRTNFLTIVPFNSMSFIIVILALFLVSCKHTVSFPSEIATRNWFVNTSNETLPALLQQHPDTLQKILQESRIYGTVTSIKGFTSLIDTNGTEFLSGYQTPVHINPDSLYPLIVYLHGGTGTQVNTKGEKAFEMLSPMADSMPLFLVSPSASKNARWWTPVGLSRIVQTLRFMTLTYPIDPSKVFLAGVSDGATGCFAAANTIPLPFAGFIAISGYGGLLPSTGITINSDNIRQRPFYNVHAGNDRLYPLETVNRFLDYLENSGVRIERKVYPNEQHGFDYRDKEFPVLISIIKRWKRETFTGSSWHFVADFPNTPVNCINWSFQTDTKEASISTYPSRDTLIVRLKGIKQVDLFQPEQYHGRIIKLADSERIFTSTGKSDQQKLKLQLMKYSCFPNSVSGIFVNITQ